MRGAFISTLLQMPEIWPENWSGQKLAKQTAGGTLRVFFEQWARIFGRVMTRPTRPVPPGLGVLLATCVATFAHARTGGGDSRATCEQWKVRA